MGYDTTSYNVLHYDSLLVEFESQPISEGCILFLGNSLTEGGDWSRLLQKPDVINQGIGGDLTFGVLRRLDKVSRHKPSQVFLMIGTNDLTRNVPDSIIVQNILSIVEVLYSKIPATQFIVQSLLPVNDEVDPQLSDYKLNPRVLAINQALRNNADKWGYTYIDLHTSFSNKVGKLRPALTYDGIHLNSKGYKLWLDILYSEALVN